MKSVELFAGTGGLALGCELAGFRSVRVVERDRWACDTIRENAAAGHPLVRDWNVVESDVRDVDWSNVGSVDLLAGGPPCQPFSVGGKSRASLDPRDMFPVTADVIAALRPKAFIVENVRGLTRPAFAKYVSYVTERLRRPGIPMNVGESWIDHGERIRHAKSSDLDYQVSMKVVNAADYGVPQQRWRVFFVGFRSDVDAQWEFPEPTHSRTALMHQQWVSGDYWERHKLVEWLRPPAPRNVALASSNLLPWRTVRDALVGVHPPNVRGSYIHRNHVLRLGAKAYPPGHTGSLIDLPAKALKAGAHGVPGGENMLLNRDGSVRYFTVREAARLQTFPDDYELHGSWTEAMRQLGNAVPVLLGQTIAESVREALDGASVTSQESVA